MLFKSKCGGRTKCGLRTDGIQNLGCGSLWLRWSDGDLTLERQNSNETAHPS